MNVYIEQILSGQFVITKAAYAWRREKIISHIETNRFNIFGGKLEDLVRSRYIHNGFLLSGEAMTGGFKTHQDAVSYAKTNRLYVLDCIHKQVMTYL